MTLKILILKPVYANPVDCAPPGLQKKATNFTIHPLMKNTIQ